MQMARSKKACLVFFDEIDAIGGARFDDGAGEGPKRHISRSLYTLSHLDRQCWPYVVQLYEGLLVTPHQYLTERLFHC